MARLLWRPEVVRLIEVRVQDRCAPARDDGLIPVELALAGHRRPRQVSLSEIRVQIECANRFLLRTLSPLLQLPFWRKAEVHVGITAIGLEIPGAPESGYTLLSPVDGAFELVDGVSHVPELHDARLTFALLTGRTFGGGRPDAGLAPSSTLTSFCVSGPFPRDMAIERMLDRGVLRFQRVGEDGEDGDIAVWTDRPR